MKAIETYLFPVGHLANGNSRREAFQDRLSHETKLVSTLPNSAEGKESTTVDDTFYFLPSVRRPDVLPTSEENKLATL